MGSGADGLWSAGAVAGGIFAFLAVPMLPVCAAFALKKKTGRGLLAVLTGALCFIGAAGVLEQLLHAVVFRLAPALPLYPAAYTAYGCLAAGIFEETGRLAGLSLLCRRDNALAAGVGYGIGHGGAEALLMAGPGAVAYLLWACGVWPQAGALFADVAPDAFWLAGAERLIAMAAHMALSILVWMGVSGRIRRLAGWCAAVLLHTVFNVPAALAQAGVLRSVWAVEGLLAAAAAALCLLVWLWYRRAEKMKACGRGNGEN